MRFLLVPVLLAAGWCGGGTPQPTPPPPPTPAPDPSPICPPVGATCGCYYMPPGQDWQQLPPCPTPTPTPIPTPGPTPTPPPATGCVPPHDDPGWGKPIPVDQRPALLYREYQQVIAAIGNTCGQASADESKQMETLRRIAAKWSQLYPTRCVEQSSDSVSARAGDNLYEEWHAVYFGNGCIIDGPNAYKGAWPYGGTPTPPPAQACPAPLPSREEGKLRIQVHVGGGWADGTIQTVGTLAYCEQIGMSPMADGTPRASCPMRSECPGFQCDLRDECELYASAGLPKWQTRPAGLEVEHRQGNPWVARAAGAAELRVCSADLSVCSAWVAAP